MALTKDWGPEFARVSDLFANKAKAAEAHQKALRGEIEAHDGSHAFGRHGFQTGWEAQFIRCVTGVSPDQAFDPAGLNPAIRQWNAGFTPMTYGANGGAMEDFIFMDSPGIGFSPLPADFEQKAGSTAGGFISPESQQRALNKAAEVLNKLRQPNHAAAGFMFNPTKKKIAFPLTSAVIVVPPARDGDAYGVAFAQRDPKNFRKHSKTFVESALNAFFNRQTVDQFIPNITAATFKFNELALRRKKLAFTNLEDLFNYFDVDVYMQKSAKLIYRRGFMKVTKTFSDWRMITMFPDTTSPGWAPGLFFDDATKQKLKADKVNKFNANVKDYVWTGKVATMTRTNVVTYPVPPWA